MNLRISRIVCVALAPVMGLGLAASCGARSELEVPKIDGSGGTGGSLPCVPGPIALTRATPIVMFVIDRSGSMQDRLSASKLSRWQILRDALAATLPPADDLMMIGAEIFPRRGHNQKSAGCAVPLVPDLFPMKHGAQSLLDLIDSTDPSGATPTAAALEKAGNLMLVERAGTSGRSMVLATDGGPNCNDDLDPQSCVCTTPLGHCKSKNGTNQCLDDVRSAKTIAWYTAHGIPTYVLGIQNEGDTQFTDVLNAMADAGGRPKAGSEHFYAARNQKDFEAAIADIRDQVAQCTYLTSTIPDAGGAFTVTVGGQEVPFDPTGMEGWRWGNEANGEVLLAGEACKSAQALGDMSVSATVECGAASSTSSASSTTATSSSVSTGTGPSAP